jgi:hypothetical protein
MCFPYTKYTFVFAKADVSLFLSEAYEAYKYYLPLDLTFDIYAAIISLAFLMFPILFGDNSTA